MFPINANDPFIKTTGERTTMGAAMGGGGSSELPEYSEADAGKVLSVDNEGDLAWTMPAATRQYSKAGSILENDITSISGKEVTT